MTDRELLELAAKAAGIEQGAERADCGISTTLSDGRHGHLPRWNPLEDDGDALRLAVKLHLIVQCNPNGTNAGRWFPLNRINELHDGDPCAATRRAIVRAAAEIGRQHD